MDSICTSHEFTGHLDPYSGEPLTVRLFVFAGGKVRYRIEGAYDTGTPYATFDEALGAWSRIGGVAGLRNPSKGGFVCAYTGRVMKPVHEPGRCRFAGGFRPMRFLTRNEVLGLLAHLAGKDAGSPPVRVEAVPETPPAPRFHDDHEPSDEALRRAGKALEASRSAMKRTGIAPAKRTLVTPGRTLKR